MNIQTILRRAFAANPRKIPALPEEQAKLEARGIVEPTLQTYLVWRRSLMIFVVLSTLVSAVLATYRAEFEAEDRMDLVTTLAERLELEEYLEDESEMDVGTTSSPPPQKKEPNAFEQFTDRVELFALYVLPLAALAAALFWTRFQFSFRINVAAFTFAFLVPMILGLLPWSWYGYIEPEYDPNEQPWEYFSLKAEGLLEGIEYLVTLLPTVLSLVPGVQRACIRVKLLLPQAMLPGWMLVAASPFYALFLFVVFIAINQFDTDPLFFAGMLIFLLAPLTYAVRSDLFTRPLASDDDLRRIRLTQRAVGILTITAVGLMVAYLATREFMDVRLLGLHYENSLLVPLDVVEFLIETISRSMFITVLGADLFMRMNYTAWKHAQAFGGSPEAANYDRVMTEFANLR